MVPTPVFMICFKTEACWWAGGFCLGWPIVLFASVQSSCRHQDSLKVKLFMCPFNELRVFNGRVENSILLYLVNCALKL